MEKKSLQRAAAAAEAEAARAHVELMHSHPLLTEAPTGILDASGRVRKDGFKGLSAETADEVRRFQESQRAEMRTAWEAAKLEDLADADRLAAALAVYDGVAAADRTAAWEAEHRVVLEVKAQQRGNKVRTASGGV
jgi:hypothetical protein